MLVAGASRPQPGSEHKRLASSRVVTAAETTQQEARLNGIKVVTASVDSPIAPNKARPAPLPPAAEMGDAAAHRGKKATEATQHLRSCDSLSLSLPLFRRARTIFLALLPTRSLSLRPCLAL